MRILVSGSTGLLGSALLPLLKQAGHTTHRLVRHRAVTPSDIFWNPERGSIDTATLEGLDAVIHLAGESVAHGRWTAAKKQRIRDSRVKGTQILADALARLPQPPKTLLAASAVGYYGNRGDELLKEDSSPGNDFLAETCREWEKAAASVAAQGVRVVQLRFGVVLSPAGGALKMMLWPFKLGVGGKIGSGAQYMSWIAIDDAISVILHCLSNHGVHGPVNVVAPDDVTNLDFTKALGRVLSRPTVLPMPAFAARLAFGEMADALLLASQRTEPRVLHKSGYAFRHPELEGALRHLLKPHPRPTGLG